MGKILFNIQYHLRNLHVSEVSAEYLLNKALTVTGLDLGWSFCIY